MILNSARISRPTLLITPVSLFHCSARLIPIAENIPNSAVKSLISEYGEHENTYGVADKRFDDENNGISFTASQCHPCFDMNRQGVATVSEAVLKPPQLAPYGVKSLSNFKTASQTKTYE